MKLMEIKSLKKKSDYNDFIVKAWDGHAAEKNSEE